MACHDVIGDMLTKVRNAMLVKHEKVDIFASKEKLEIIKILKNEGFIKNFKKLNEKNSNIFRIYLKYNITGKSVIFGLKRISTPGRRVYKGYKEIPRLYNGIGIYIVSTSQGIITGKKAIDRKIGGEILCAVW